jgi:hypothetical protein
MFDGRPGKGQGNKRGADDECIGPVGVEDGRYMSQIRICAGSRTTYYR